MRAKILKEYEEFVEERRRITFFGMQSNKEKNRYNAFFCTQLDRDSVANIIPSPEVVNLVRQYGKFHIGQLIEEAVARSNLQTPLSP